jgi:hypothetical protein
MIYVGIWNFGEGDTNQDAIGGGQEEEGKEIDYRVHIKYVGQGRCFH